MKDYKLNIIELGIKNQVTLHKFMLSFFLCLLSFVSFSQVKTSIDSTSIKIGEQITYKIELEVDTTDVVIFPEGQTFLPLEMIESYKTDTTKLDAKYNLIKKYGLTQFDSGRYVIPKQKVIINNKPFLTDSLLIEVNNVVVDTTKQKLFDIKPIIEVKKRTGNWWIYLLIALFAIALVAFLMYWFIWRKKPLTEEEEIALLPPYDRAKLALKKLDESSYLENAEMKDYYSELTFIIRKYLDEKVYDRALESTTDELVSRLRLLKDGNQIDLSKDDIHNIETILKRADLVKFAKSAPDIELAKIDRNTIDVEIDQVKEALPEPTEEEKLLDQQYKEEQERKKRRKKIWLTVAISIALMIATYVGFGLKLGFAYVTDTITGKDTKQLLEGEWITSDYGFPPITVSTPEVLKRENPPIPEEMKDKIKMSVFGYMLEEELTIAITNTQLPPKNPQQTEEDRPTPEIQVSQVVEETLKGLEAQGARNIISNSDKFITPNGAEGAKIFGTLEAPIRPGSDKYMSGRFTLLAFANDVAIQQVIITYAEDDVYLIQIHDRILESLELIKPKTE